MQKILSVRERRYTIGSFFYASMVVGAFFSVIGAAMPQIKAEYQLDYQTSGLMISALSVGYLIAGMLVGVVAELLGKKRTYLIFGSFHIVGLALIMTTSNPILLLCATAMAGIGRGVVDTFGNQTVSVVSGGNATQINLLQAFYSMGTCVAPLITLACGSSWRTAFVLILVLSVINTILGIWVTMDAHSESKHTEKKALDLGFVRSELFWICAVFFVCYLSVEDTMIGWLVTYLTDSKLVTSAAAQMITSLFWMAILTGRLASAWLSKYFSAQHMLFVMAVGMTAGFSIMTFAHTAIRMVIGLLGMGLFMAGIFGTGLANSGDLIRRYPLVMGMYIAIPGIGAAILPGVVGAAANRIGITNGIRVLFVVMVVLLVTAVLNLRRK